MSLPSPYPEYRAVGLPDLIQCIYDGRSITISRSKLNSETDRLCYEAHGCCYRSSPEWAAIRSVVARQMISDAKEMK